MRANGADFLTLRGGNLGIEFEASNGAAVADLSSSQFSLKTGVADSSLGIAKGRQLPGGHGGAPAARQSIPEPQGGHRLRQGDGPIRPEPLHLRRCTRWPRGCIDDATGTATGLVTNAISTRVQDTELTITRWLCWTCRAR